MPEHPLEASKKKLETDVAKQKQIAMNVDLRSPFHDDAPWEKNEFVLEEDAPELHVQLQARTRLSEPTVTIGCVLKDGAVLRTPSGDLVEPDTDPGFDAVRCLRLATVSLANRKWVRFFLNSEPPPAWRRSAHLRDVRLAVFGADRRLRAEGVPGSLELSQELGLVIHRADSVQGGP